MDYVLQIAGLIVVYAILAESMDLASGHTGLLSLAHAGFFGIGAYVAGILTLRTGCGFTVGLLGAACVAAIVSFGFSVPTLRLNDDYFVIGTFAFQMILSSILDNWVSVTHGSLGIRGIPRARVGGFEFNSPAEFLVLGCCCFVLVKWIVNRLVSSPFGRVLHAIREDEIFAKANGKNTLYFKIIVFAFSAGLAASAGSLYAHYVSYIDPSSFTVMESILILSMTIVGGAGSRWGPVMGAVLLVGLPELLRFLGVPSSFSANVRQMVYGSLLIIMIMFRPRGVVGHAGFSQRGI